MVENNDEGTIRERKILDSHGGDYDECRLLDCYALWLL
jgi:hypothetical protein